MSEEKSSAFKCNYVVLEVRKTDSGKVARVIAQFEYKYDAQAFDAIANANMAYGRAKPLLGFGWCSADRIWDWAESYSALIEE